MPSCDCLICRPEAACLCQCRLCANTAEAEAICNCSASPPGSTDALLIFYQSQLISKDNCYYVLYKLSSPWAMTDIAGFCEGNVSQQSCPRPTYLYNVIGECKCHSRHRILAGLLCKHKRFDLCLRSKNLRNRTAASAIPNQGQGLLIFQKHATDIFRKK